MSNPYSSQINQLQQKIATNRALLTDPDLAALARQEITELEQQLQILEQVAAEFSSDTRTDEVTSSLPTPKNCILEIRPGTGGDEAKIWAHDLLRMYLRLTEKLNLKVEVIDDLVVKIRGQVRLDQLSSSAPDEEMLTVYQLLRYESGVHRVQRIPTAEAQGRIHTSTASVAVLPEVHPTAVMIKDDDLEWQFMRSSGAGGQNVNKVNTAVRLTHRPTGMVVVSRQERTQARNRDIALELLRSQLWEITEERRLAQIGQARSVIGRNMRAEKIRTYNFPQNRVTDHRLNHSWYNLESIIEGNLEPILAAVYQQTNLREE